ncbi:hypothetical protein DNTS_029639 [Danionella cerebrum]|uniref:Aquaporin n=1 Tax=Danionella cerebrum TaxID=2873325 RepID=A0A553QPL4_9TELE|nr:hypothetical protein DNTS_029639 [Danionella translucida]
MSGLNASLGYFSVVACASLGTRLLLRRWAFVSEFTAAFALAAFRLEVDTIAEVGQWAGALGRDVAITMLFISIAVHAILMQDSTGNPSLTLMGLLQKEISVASATLSVAAQFFGAFVAIAVAAKFWEMELSDMHMVKNLMWFECSTSLRVGVLQGALVEGVSALGFYLIFLVLKSRSQLLRIPVLALMLTFIAYAANDYTSGYVNPSLAYAMTFTCPGSSYLEYSLVYWIAPVIGMTVALFLFLGNLPLLFSRKLLYSRKSRFRAPKAKASEEKTS